MSTPQQVDCGPDVRSSELTASGYLGRSRSVLGRHLSAELRSLWLVGDVPGIMGSPVHAMQMSSNRKPCVQASSWMERKACAGRTEVDGVVTEVERLPRSSAIDEGTAAAESSGFYRPIPAGLFCIHVARSTSGAPTARAFNSKDTYVIERK